MSYLLLGSTPEAAMHGYRVAAMMPRLENDQPYENAANG